MRRSALAVAAALVCLLAVPSIASAKVKWLCGPGVKNDPCRQSFRTTVFQGWNTKLRVDAPKAAKRPKIDCFYVYPTVSNQPGDVATKAADPEIKDIALFQAARYSATCRVFAPVYRQVTVQGLNRSKYPAAAGNKDLLEAWKLFLSKYSKGRGFVLIGHSQGTFRLITLIRQQIDKSPKLRKRLVSAILLGGSVEVKQGSDRGGSFQNVPACRRESQLHCVVAFSSFNDTPPADSVFGRPGSGFAPGGDGLEVLCTNPASLADNALTPLDSMVPSKPFAPGTLIAAGISLLHLDYPKAPTPWLESKGAFSGQCSTDGGASFLKITSNPGTPVPTPSPNAQWGLHLLDANIAMGNLVKLVATQAKAYSKRS